MKRLTIFAMTVMTVTTCWAGNGWFFFWIPLPIPVDNTVNYKDAEGPGETIVETKGNSWTGYKTTVVYKDHRPSEADHRAALAEECQIEMDRRDNKFKEQLTHFPVNTQCGLQSLLHSLDPVPDYDARIHWTSDQTTFVEEYVPRLIEKWEAPHRIEKQIEQRREENFVCNYLRTDCSSKKKLAEIEAIKRTVLDRGARSIFNWNGYTKQLLENLNSYTKRETQILIGQARMEYRRSYKPSLPEKIRRVDFFLNTLWVEENGELYSMRGFETESAADDWFEARKQRLLNTIDK